LSKRKRGAGGAGGSGSVTGLGSINAAPSISPVDAEDGVDASRDGGSEHLEPKMKKPDLLGTLRGQFPFTAPSGFAGNGNKKAKVDESSKSVEKKKDDYEKFVEEIGDIL
jgi:hypothetical protein